MSAPAGRDADGKGQDPRVKRIECGAVLFDLDGVLVDSTESVERAWKAWAQAHGLDAGEIIRVAHGRRTVETIRLVAPHLFAETEAVALEKSEAEDTSGVLEVLGALELVAGLPQSRWAVVTSGTRLIATARLRAMGLPLPETLVTADDVTNGKPHPEGYLRAARKIGVDPSECVVVEDAPPGIQAARAAGMRVIAVAATYPAARLADADVVVETLADLRLNEGVFSPSDRVELLATAHG